MKLNKLIKLTIALEDLGIETILQLLKKCKTPASRREFVEALVFTDVDLKKFVKTANLMQIEGIGENEIKLLKAVGIDTVKELMGINAKNLQKKLEEYGIEKKISIPREDIIKSWIEQSKSLVQKSEKNNEVI